MGHIHQLRHRHLGKLEAKGPAGADILAPRQLGAPVLTSSTDSGGSDDSNGGGTVLSIVYVTASPTFTGAIGGYTTLAVGAPVQQSVKSSNTADAFATPTSESQSPTSVQPTSNASTFSTMTSAAVISGTSLATSVSQSSSSPAITGGAIAEGTASATPQASPSTVQTGMSAGGKTGLAIGIILAVAIVAAGVLFLYWKKKKAVEEEEKSHNEKAAFAGDAAPVSSSSLHSAPPPPSDHTSSAPTLDLRPMSRLMPEFMGQRRSQGNLLNAPPAAAASGAAGRSLMPPQEASAWERKANATNEKVENPFSDPTNPFGDEQAKAVSPSLGGPAAPVPGPSVPAPLNVRSVAPGAAAPVAAAEAATGAAIAGAAVAAAKPPASPAGGHSTTQSQGAVGAAAGPGAPPNNVYAVQLDFKPSMDDELELRSGQLVRILHEYDDGWVSRTSRKGRSVLINVTGPVRSPRPLPTGSRSSNLSVSQARETSSYEQWPTPSRSQRSPWTSSWSEWPSYDTKWRLSSPDVSSQRPGLSTNDSKRRSSSTNVTREGSRLSSHDAYWRSRPSLQRASLNVTSSRFQNARQLNSRSAVTSNEPLVCSFQSSTSSTLTRAYYGLTSRNATSPTTAKHVSRPLRRRSQTRKDGCRKPATQK